jgi:hypothetical protein
MSYEHHVFISYCWMPRKEERKVLHAWVQQFAFLLREGLMVNLPSSSGKPVFVDDDCRTGPDFRIEIADAHQRSAVLVPVLDAQYFSSHWCQAEWDAFIVRERAAGQMGLIYPVGYGGEDYWGEARYRLPADLSKHAILYDFRDPTPGCQDFQQVMLRISKEIAALVRKAPAHQPDWPKIEYPQWDRSTPPALAANLPT